MTNIRTHYIHYLTTVMHVYVDKRYPSHMPVMSTNGIPIPVIYMHYARFTNVNKHLNLVITTSVCSTNRL